MRDLYFFKSLFSTSLAYLLILCALIGFTSVTGVAGVLLISAIVILLLSYFYTGSGRQ